MGKIRVNFIKFNLILIGGDYISRVNRVSKRQGSKRYMVPHN